MLLDALSEGNSLVINCKAINILGLSTAAYVTVLIDIYRRAIRKNKLDNGYFKVDRSYIQRVLNMSTEEQLICDSNLLKVSVLKKATDDPNRLILNLNLYLSLLSSEDIKLIEDVRKQMKVMKPKGVKQSQRQIQINALKNCIQCSNYELLTALREWVDGVYARPNGFLSKTAIRVFQDTLNNYTQGDLDLALRIVQIATIQGYRDCQWAINTYEKDQRMVNSASSKIRVTRQEIASSTDLSDQVF